MYPHSTGPPPMPAAAPPQRSGSHRGERDGGRRGPGTAAAQPQPPEPQYIVYLRLPFARNGFVDPPQVDWDASKERYLWKVLSRNNRNAEFDWDALAGQLQVSRAFLLQQAAWLYERELSQIQAQMRRVGTGVLNTSYQNPPSPGGQSPISGGFPVPKTANTTTEPRIPSALATRSTATPTPRPTPAAQPSVVGTPRPNASPMSRTSSGAGGPSSRAPQLQPTTHRFSCSIPADGDDTSPPEATQPSSSSVSEGSMDGASSSSSDEDERDENPILRKLPAFLKKQHNSSSDDEGAEAEPAFLPFSAGEASSSANMSGTVTLGVARRVSGAGSRKGKASVKAENDGSVESGTLSPRINPLRRSARASPASSRGRPVSDSAGPSSPSICSSFSDLSDASVSQSAMEEAYLSTMQGGGMASRMSSIGQAVRSRYFPPSQ